MSDLRDGLARAIADVAIYPGDPLINTYDNHPVVREQTNKFADAALAHLRATIPGFEALQKGEAVIVPHHNAAAFEEAMNAAAKRLGIASPYAKGDGG